MDALRGFSLLGILVVNIAFLASGYRMAGLAEPAFHSPLDWGVRWTVTLLLENKFYLLFSFLFGYSFTLQLDSAARLDRPFVPMFLRRLAGLFLLALGFVLLALMAMAGHDMSGTVAGEAAEATRSDAALGSGFWEIVAEHVRELSSIIMLRVLFQGPAVLAACLIGLAVGKLGALRDLSAHTRTLRRLQWTGFTVGLAGACFYTLAAWNGTAHKFWGEAVDLVTAPLLAAAYGATFLRLLRHLPRLGRALAAPGRMALSNYLAQSLICALIFTGYGLALVDRVSPPVEVPARPSSSTA
ncbi:DUF418 domain-containing protein [Nonomuraea polychroma]|uniref:DUF418 domain-containing protein n=1 Tax=Nonomuraea polychroma TaxID=46176 RepID=UPI003D8D038E